MSLELNLSFASPTQVMVQLDGAQTDTLDFSSPLAPEEQDEIRWYLETYASSYIADVDVERARRLEARLPEWGEALFNAVFTDPTADRLFFRFQDDEQPGRLVTVSASHPAVLSLPWELLRAPSGGYLLHERGRISVRRNLTRAGGGRRGRVEAKAGVHLLFVVSRPSDVPFIDPRSDPGAVLDALERSAHGRVTYEFLRPATLDALVERLEDEDLPAVDILHFDGHGAYDPDGRMAERAGKLVVPAALGSEMRDSGDTTDAGNVGYLLFEEDDGKQALVSAQLLGEMLHRQSMPLVVLSACQSAAVAAEDAMGSVSARLADAGIAAVVAMPHSVLVTTTRLLFGTFYRELAKGRPIGTALDTARRALYRDPKRGERVVGEHERRALTLQDWFLPALYQGGADAPVLEKGEAPDEAPARRWGNLPDIQEAGFFGRSLELWRIERAFVGGTQRLTVTGFGGQGKTYLALETASWLCRTGMFEDACLVSYASYAGEDALGLAVSTLGTVLESALVDAEAAGEALVGRRLLLILDNLESLGREAKEELLSTATKWSQTSGCRVLLTTRQPDLEHPDYGANSNVHRYLRLEGLGEADAVAYFEALMLLPPEPTVPKPERHALVALFDKVAFHPLSIGLLAGELKVRRPAELGERLEALLAAQPEEAENRTLLASLNLSLERLEAGVREWLPRLGVFHGGAMEDDLQVITELDDSQWAALRAGLERTGLIEVEYLPGAKFPYLRFHPTLAPALWPRLDDDDKIQLAARHRERYYLVANYLYASDSKHPGTTRAMARRELPNLLHAAHAALDAGDERAVDMVEAVAKFLNNFGLGRDRAELATRAQAAAGEVGSDAWYLTRSAQAQQFLATGQHAEAQQTIQDILSNTGDGPTHQRSLALAMLGRSLRMSQRTREALRVLQEALAVAEQLPPSEHVTRHMGLVHAETGDIHRAMGDYAEARAAYETSLAIDMDIDDIRGAAVINGQLGTLAMLQGNLQEAATRYEEAMQRFRQLGEPEMESVAWHQLGMVHQEARHWDEAEQAYRESARICESLGHITGENGAEATWHQLGLVMVLAGKSGEAEAWYRKSLDATKAAGDLASAADSLINLADLLKDQPERLEEAQALAEEALAIKCKLDPDAAKIWTTLRVLAAIAELQGQPEEADAYRQKSRVARAEGIEAENLLRNHAPLIASVLRCISDADQSAALAPVLDGMQHRGWTELVAAIRLILGGARDESALCRFLDSEDSLIVGTILRAIDDPESLRSLFDPATENESADPASANHPEDAPAPGNSHAELIAAASIATLRPETRSQLDDGFAHLTSHGYGQLVETIREIWNGERDAATLSVGLDPEDTDVVRAILRCLDDPEHLRRLVQSIEQ